MAQILLIEPDDLAVVALKKIFLGDEEIKLNFIENFTQAEEILNGSPHNKELYEKYNRGYDEAKKEFQAAAAAELSAKTINSNTTEILEKYENELEGLKNPEGDTKKTPTETSEVKIEAPIDPQKDIQIKTLEKEIERLRAEVKIQKEQLLAATKLKTDKEKISADKLALADEAKANIPAPANQIYSVLMISSNLMLPSVPKWLEFFKNRITFDANKDIKIIVLGFDPDEKSVKKYLVPRVSDYMIKPVDELLAKQNIKFLALSGKNAKREVYSLQVKEPVDLVYEYELEGLSEFSFVIKSASNFEINEFKAFSSDLFLRKGQRGVLGKCLNSKEHPKGGFISEFWFVGMDTHLAFQIKTVIKNAPKL